MAAAWTLLGVLNLTDGRTVLGVAELVLAGLSVVAAVPSRAASFLDAPVFRRKRPEHR